MTDAIVTDINEYRTKKEANSVLSNWSDDKLRSRFKVLKMIAEGATYLTDPSNPLVRRNFPKGFDPENHPGENMDMISAEATRRGVMLT